MASFSSAVYTPDNLLAGNAALLMSRQITVAAGQTLPRGAVLGLADDSKYYLTASAADDGSEVPDASLVEDVDATGGDVQALVYVRGDFNENAVTLGTGHTVASVREALRGKGIFLVPATEV